MLEILNKPAEKTTDNDVKYVKSLFEKYGSIEYARKKAESLVKSSKAVIKDMPPKLRDLLDYFGNYLIERKE